MQNQRVQPRSGLGSIADKFKTGVEWQPSRPAPRQSRNRNEVAQPSEQIKRKVGDLLKDYFSHEQPPADDITILPGSLRLVDVAHDIWVASVQTIITYRTIEPRIHVSRVRFRVLHVKLGPDIEKHKFSIHHNHVIFI